MLFLFEDTLIPYIYIVFYTLISMAQSSQSWQLLSYEQTRHTDRNTIAMICAASRHEQPHPDGIRAHNNRHTITNDPGNLHAMNNHTQNHTQGAHTNRHTITPPGFRIYGKPNLTASIPMGNSWAAADS